MTELGFLILGIIMLGLAAWMCFAMLWRITTKGVLTYSVMWHFLGTAVVGLVLLWVSQYGVALINRLLAVA